MDGWASSAALFVFPFARDQHPPSKVIMVRISALNDALKSMYNAEKRGKQQVMIRPSFKATLVSFEYVDDHRSGKIVVKKNGRLSKCGVKCHQSSL
ncbi:hypothetical protein U9M48_017220 [Paspalum notatum var. saurae]|uniref:Small ribosomal subunit protein uS8c n=1 Tax=Paspalum notatum var. saurae TaxID=547442 RepID=A0AAQ3WNM2_PASNO